jgi:nicotinate-nucleotide adenylyltransferase
VRILVFGGTFSPVHWGHLVLAEEVREEFSYDLVLLVPALQPPHKDTRGEPGPAHRLEMLRLAIEGNPSLAVDDCELSRPGPSYTIDTLRGLGSRWSLDGKPGLVLGDDLVRGFPSWKEPDAIAAEADLIVARRTGQDVDLPYPHCRAGNRLVVLSSSDIRERIGQGLSIRYLVPESVRAYIRDQGLYGAR